MQELYFFVFVLLFVCFQVLMDNALFTFRQSLFNQTGLLEQLHNRYKVNNVPLVLGILNKNVGLMAQNPNLT